MKQRLVEKLLYQISVKGRGADWLGFGNPLADYPWICGVNLANAGVTLSGAGLFLTLRVKAV